MIEHVICFLTQLAKFSADSDERPSVISSFQESIAAANADQMLILNDKLDQKVSIADYISDPGLVGLSLSYALNVTGSLNMLVSTWWYL